MSNTVNVAKLAKLTNVPITDDEVAKFSAQFETTLNTIAMLSELNTTTVTATPQVISTQNVTREDEVDTSRMFSREQALANAKQTHNGYFVVPAVLGE